MRKYGAVFLALLLVSSVAVADEIDNFIGRQINRNHIPGAAIAVVQDGKLVRVAGYGVANLDWENPVTPDTKFQIASTTKPFTGLLLMSLVADDKVKLDESVRTYLPNAPESWQSITVRMLATHSSGLKFNLGEKKFKSVDEAVEEACKLPLDYEPGTESHYGLTDFVVLTKVLEMVGGKTYPELLRERVLEPLGLHNTRFDNLNDDGPSRNWEPLKKRSTTYRWTGTSEQAYAFFYPSWTYSAGGLFTTAEDMAKLLLAISEGKFLNPDLLNQMWAPFTLKSGAEAGFAIGWTTHKYRGLRVVGHSGGPALSDIAYFPDLKLGVVVLTNQQRLFPMLAETIANFYLPPSAQPAEKAVEDPNPEMTAKLERVITWLGNGKLKSELFTDEAKKEIVPMLTDFGPVIVNQLDPLSRMYLIERKVTGTGMQLVYRVYFGDRPMKWIFVLDTNGKISYLEPKSSD